VFCGAAAGDADHATQIRTARHARHALAYVLNNWRRHREDVKNPRAREAMLDPYASGLAFEGWSKSLRFRVPVGYEPLPASPPTTSLLSFDWQRFGLVDFYERPGPLSIYSRAFANPAHAAS